jgi:hypothetical protein
MTTVYGAVAVICSPKTGDATLPPAGQVIAIAGTGGGGGATGLDERGDVEVGLGSAWWLGVETTAATSDAGAVSVEWELQLPTMPKIATRPRNPATADPFFW